MIIFLIVLAILAFWFIAIYNGFIRLRNRADEAWSGIDVQLKRRYDLIPNVVETVKGYAKHEQGTFQKVVQARAQAINASGVKAQAEAENMLTGALKSLFAVAEAYPDLKANQNFMELQKTLAELEEQIQMSRRYYNGVVRDYNIQCEAFPSALIASMFAFKKRDFFEINESEKQNVKVSF
ncbi:MAG: LemA family protein [bacterium]|nr:LemA family protein [bacterium]